MLLVIQVYRVIEPFEAQQLHHEPLRIEIFEQDDELIVLTREDSYTTFCRVDDSAELSKRAQFIITDLDFERSTEPQPPSD